MPRLRKTDIAYMAAQAVQHAMLNDPEDDPQGSLLGLLTLSDLVGSDGRVDAEDE